MLYRILKTILKFGIRLFYKEVKVVNIGHLNHNGPMILIANHPNTIMDAWMLGFISKRPIHFMAKATFFNSKFKRWLLGRLHMIPVNRASESRIKGVSNTDSFEFCYELLENGGVLAIFPEGTSYQERKLRKLKSGAARIALEVEKRNEGKLNLKIFPIGLFYSDAEKFRSQVLIHVGKGITVDEFFINNDVKGLNHLFATALQQVIPSPALTENENEVEELVTLLWAKNHFQFKTVKAKVAMYNQLQEKIQEIALVKPYEWKLIVNEVSALKWKLKKLNLPEAILRKSAYHKVVRDKLIFNLLLQMLFLPINLFGWFHNFIPFKITDFILNKYIKEIEYHAPIGILIGFILYPIQYMVWTKCLGVFFDLNLLLSIVYWFTMIFSGLIAYSFLKKIKLMIGQLRWYFFLRKRKALMVDIFHQMEKILKQLED